MNLHFFTLLYIAEHKESKHLSGRNISGEEKILIYLKNCHILHSSLKINKQKGLTVLTNNKNYIESLREKYHLCFEIEQIEFNLSVPQDIGFYSAHFKIDTYKYFSTLTDTYSILLDNDMVCTKPLPSYITELIEKDIAIHYSFPTTKVENHNINTMKNLKSEIITGEWSGGEFIGGTSKFFNELYINILSFIDKYFENRNKMFHQGDEMLTSIAIEYMKLQKWNIVDSGNIGLSYRYYSITERCNIETYNSCFYHLICDKLFLASLVNKPFTSNEDFFSLYNKYFSRKVRIKKYIKKLISPFRVK